MIFLNSQPIVSHQIYLNILIMKKILMFLLTSLLALPLWSQIDFSKASKEDVAKFYDALPPTTALKNFRENPDLNPEVKVIDADSMTNILTNGQSCYKEKWIYSYYTGDIRPTDISHGFVDEGKTYVLMISANRQRGLILVKEGKTYEDICQIDIAWVRGKLIEVKDMGQGLIIAKIIHLAGQAPSYLVINIKTKKTEWLFH